MGVLDLFSLTGKVALVTGGAGRHAPKFIQALAEAGALVYGADINNNAMQTVADDLCRRGLDVHPLYLDQGSEQSILTLRDEILERSGRIDVLVNAAVGRSMHDWEDDASKFAESMRINATGLFLMTRTFADVMAQQGGGSIINIASMYGMVAPDRSLYEGLDFHGFIPDYFFHKGGMISFTRFVASYYAPKNIRCNCMSPGGVLAPQPREEFVRRFNARTMLGRMADALDLMGVVVFLASDASQYITAANIVVDGGYTAM